MKKNCRRHVCITVILIMGSVLYLTCGKESTKSPPCLTLTVTGNGDGHVGIEPGADCYYEGSQVTLTAYPDTGWQFDNWSGDFNSTDNPATVTFANSNLAITANFSEIEYVISVTVSPANSGTVQIDPDQPTYNLGDWVTLTAIPNEGYQFSYWSGLPAGSDSSDNPVEGEVCGDLSLTAYFVEEQVNSATISGTITWAGHELSDHTYAFADSFDGSFLYLVAQTDVNPVTGSYTITINDMPGPLDLLFEAQDDVNNSAPWYPIDAGDGWGFYDYDGNGQWEVEDVITVSPGDDLTGIDISLEEVIPPLSEKPNLERKSQ